MKYFSALICTAVFSLSLAHGEESDTPTFVPRELSPDSPKSTGKAKAGEKGVLKKKMMKKMQSASPEDRAKMQQRMEQLKNATPEQRAKMQQRMEQFKNASPEEREKMKAEFKSKGQGAKGKGRMEERLQNASPEQRAQMMERLEKFKSASPEEREKMKTEMKEKMRSQMEGVKDSMQGFKDMSAAEQLEVMKNPEFWKNKPPKMLEHLKQRYNKLSEMNPRELEAMDKELKQRELFTKSGPDEKFEAMQDPEFWTSVPEDRVEKLKAFYEKWSTATDAEKEKIREFHNKIKDMSPDERRKMKHKHKGKQQKR